MNNRLQYLDIARGIGILMVMYSHSMYNDNTVMIYISGCFIPVFFVISGYLSKPVGGGNLWRRIKYLLGPYTLFNILLCAIYCIFNRGISVQNIVGVFYSRFCLYPINVESNVRLMEMWNSPMWFLTAMVVTVCFWEFLSHRKKRSIVYWSLIFFIAILLMQRFPVLLPWSIDVAPLYALYMLAGYILKRFNMLEKIKLVYTMGFLLLYVLICSLNGTVNLSTRDYGASPIFVMVTGIIGSILIIKLSMFLERVAILSKLLSIVGRNSICVFCSHVLTFALLYKIYSYLYSNYDVVVLSYFLLIIDIVIGLLFGVIFSIILKKYMPSFIR